MAGRRKNRTFEAGEFYIGLRYGTLTLVCEERASKSRKTGTTYLAWRCRCDCGAIVHRSRTLICDRKQGSCYSCGMDRLKKPLKEIALDRVTKRYRRQASERGLSFELTQEDVEELILRSCYYCGIEHSNFVVKSSRRRNYDDKFFYNGIDRVDNSIGYTADNVVPCCKTCNSAKSNLRQADFLALVKRIYEHRVVVGATPAVSFL